MRNLKSEELAHVYGAGGRGKQTCHKNKGRHGTGSKGRRSHGRSKRRHGST